MLRHPLEPYPTTPLMAKLFTMLEVQKDYDMNEYTTSFFIYAEKECETVLQRMDRITQLNVSLHQEIPM